MSTRAARGKGASEGELSASCSTSQPQNGHRTLTISTRPAHAPGPHSYYAYWERRLFGAVSSMVVSGLQAFHTRLAACRPAGPAEEAGSDADSSQPGKPPLFRVSWEAVPAACHTIHRDLARHAALRTCSHARSPRVPPLNPTHPSLHLLPQVSLALLASEVVVTPSTAEASKQLGRLLRNLVESAKPFRRWMDGTCLEAPEQ